MMGKEKLQSQLQQEAEHIKVPDYLQSQIRERIEQECRIETGKNKMNKNRSKKKAAYLTSAFAAAALITIGSGFGLPTMADMLSRVPIVGAIYENVSADFGLKEAREKGITQGYTEAKTDHDIEMAINDVYYDGTSFTIGYNLINKGSEKWTKDFVEMDMDIDAKGIDLGQYQTNNQMEKLNESTFEGLVSVDADHFEEEFIMAVDINKIDGQKGDWDFDIPVTSEFLQGSIHSFTPDFKTEAIGADVTIKAVIFAPSGAQIIAETISRKGTGNNIGFNIKGVGVAGGGSGDFGEKHGKHGKDHIIHRVNLNPVPEVPKEITVVIYDMTDFENQVEVIVPLK
ncbi:DUF4179 domain-containing protein [Bacillus sp. M6-12]|uniref:DUF4179 domain-containing protein n=1 Tax=Bacillus sp. M6-12 TaxID=2054166 RepID=UPI0015E0E8C9|nr:DUF4179 domain-containing protein [Bacillus sp. M6-12]